MRPEELLGLPLEEALRRWEAEGRPAPAVTHTQDPRGARPEGTLRLVRVREGNWTVARFADGDPRPPEP